MAKKIVVQKIQSTVNQLSLGIQRGIAYSKNGSAKRMKVLSNPSGKTELIRQLLEGVAQGQ